MLERVPVLRRISDGVLVAAGATTASLFLYLVLRGGQVSSLATWPAVSIPFAILTLLFFTALLLGPAARVATAVLTVSVTVGLYAAELMLAKSSSLGSGDAAFWMIDTASADHKAQIAALARTFGVTMDVRDRIDVISDLHRQHVEAVPAVLLGPILGGHAREQSTAVMPGALLPLGGVSRSVTVLCNESGQYVTYTSDEHGMRNPRGIWSSPHADLVAVGESFVQGYCVPDGAGFVDALRARFPITLNLGISGESSLLQLAAIKEYLPRYQPKIVLWFFCEGIDLPDLDEESRQPLVMRYLEPRFTQHLSVRQPEIDDVLRHFLSEAATRVRDERTVARQRSLRERVEPILKLWDLREKLQAMQGASAADQHVWSTLERTDHNLLSDALGQAQVLTKGWGGTLYFVYLPSWNRYRNGLSGPERERGEVLRVVNALHIPTIDITPVFTAHQDPLSLFPFRRFGHYNEAGNALVANALLKSLVTPARKHFTRVSDAAPFPRKRMRSGSARRFRRL